MAPLLEVKQLCKTFGNNVSALDSVSLSVEQGEIFGIIGLSGAGKSTLIRCLAHLDIPTSGEILFEGKDLCTFDKSALRSYRKQIGMIFQHFNLLSSRTVSENIAYPLEINGLPQKERIDELLDLVGLKHRKNAFPSHLSGGEKQRVGIARAIANKPKLLLCDEATSALDPKTTKEILALLKMLKKTLGLTIVLITHEMDVVKQICDRVAVLSDGKVVETGIVAEVFADPKHAVTKSFLEHAPHELPPHILKPSSERHKLLRLSFKGEKAKTAVISHMIKAFDVEANILMGWIDALETTVVGTLIIEISGAPDNLSGAQQYLTENTAHCEEIRP